MANQDLNKKFVCGLTILTRMDYESMPCAMCASEFTDEQMQELVNKLHNVLAFNYGYTDNEVNNLEDGSDEMETYEDAFWLEMENIAIDMGMQYYDDMTNK